MYSVLNYHNVAKYIEFYLGELWFNVTSTGNSECLKRALQLYFKYYSLRSVTKTFILKTFKYKRFHNIRHTVTFGIPL
jgi:hypothetical protein